MNADAALQRLIDKDQIRDVLMRYCRAVDRQDIDLLLSLYHADATEDHGAYKGPAVGFAKHLLSVMRTQYELGRHSIGTVNIEIENASAFVESSFEAVCILRQRTSEGGRQIRAHSGRYLDQFEKRDGVWAIAHRIVVKDYIEFRPISDEPDGYPVARSDREDLVYRLRAGTASFAP